MTASRSLSHPEETPPSEERRIPDAARAKLTELLAGTSRTFAAAIPLLSSPREDAARVSATREEDAARASATREDATRVSATLREEVTVAYLLLRIADTFEDAEAWPVATRNAALASFAEKLSSPHGSALATMAVPPGFDEAHRELLAEAPLVFEALDRFSEAASAAIKKHVLRTIFGMQEFLVLRADASKKMGIELTSLEELFRYCYIVAGIVGELLTDLFLIAEPALLMVEKELREGAATFGEALQLVNILKDREADAAEGRSFLPENIPLSAVFERAHHDCARAALYTETLEKGGASGGILAFTRFPLRVATETLIALEKDGAGAKIGRTRVLTILTEERELAAKIDARCGDATSQHRGSSIPE